MMKENRLQPTNRTLFIELVLWVSAIVGVALYIMQNCIDELKNLNFSHLSKECTVSLIVAPILILVLVIYFFSKSKTNKQNQ